MKNQEKKKEEEKKRKEKQIHKKKEKKRKKKVRLFVNHRMSVVLTCIIVRSTEKSSITSESEIILLM